MILYKNHVSIIQYFFREHNLFLHYDHKNSFYLIKLQQIYHYSFVPLLH